MSKQLLQARAQLTDRMTQALQGAMEKGMLPNGPVPELLIEVPGDRSHGDLSCNVAMVGAKQFHKNPRETAAILCECMSLEETFFSKVEVAGPGFINFFYKPELWGQVLLEICENGEDYGKSDFGKGEKVMVEFVSANPTGPMHIGNARGGALGDCLSAVLGAAGFSVAKEFYVNDAGNQLDKFGMSLDIRYQQAIEGDAAPEMPEDSYHGEDIIKHVEAYIAAHGDGLMALSEGERRRALVAFALPKNIETMQADMARYGIVYDKWFYESSLHESGEVEQVADLMREKGLTYEQDGALWYRATAFGGEKDEVIIRQNGNPTYFLVDIAYHRNKFRRGFSRLIDCWGADHHGHVARMKTAMNAVGERGDKLDIVLYQMVNLVKDGQVVRMSKRTGKAIQLADLLDEVSRDAARFTFNTHEPNMAMDFDLDIAVQQDSQNPVYYVQYAHARICSILKNLEKEGIVPRICTGEELKLLTASEEIALKQMLAAFTEEIIRSAKAMDPSCITKYVINLATLFHKFYNSCRVKGEEAGLLQARLCLCVCTRTVIRNVLTMFGISIPDVM